MTPVYSGGLIYEYSFEKVIIDATGAAYGIVDISGNTVKERPDFTALQKAFQKTPIPSDDGGYSTVNKASLCPPVSHTWLANTSLPSIPQGATKFMSQGAGTGPGLKDLVGSHFKGNPSTGPWTPIGASSEGSNSGSSTGSTPSGSTNKSAALVSSSPNMSFLLIGMALLFMI
jgi:1,3-beta-glucanosyltransferase GAS5